MPRTRLLALALVTTTACGDAVLNQNDPTLQVVDQSLDTANQITIQKVVAPAVGFVVIREDEAGTPGALVGKLKVEQGTSKDIALTLDRAARDGELLHAVLHRDTGTPGAFAFDSDPTIDPPVTNEAGDVVKASFTVAVSGEIDGPSVTAVDQVADPANQVVVAKVVSAGPGFIAIHADDAGEIGGALAYAAVPQGTSSDVQVILPRAATDGERLHAVLHVDDGVIGTWEFEGGGGQDAPATDAEGQVVAAPFTVTLPVVAGPAITVEDQRVDPLDQVVVPEVQAEVDGFVVIREDDLGQLGPVIGHAAVSRGTTADVAVTLAREVVSGERLHAVLHLDSGVVGTFEYDGENGLDPAVSDAQGVIVAGAFVVRFEPRVTAQSQTVDPTDRVVVSEVRVNGPGWLLIQADEGGPGEVLGRIPVQHGTNADLPVTLSRHVRSGETLFAALHTDDGVVGDWEYDGVNGLDLPVEDSAGVAVTAGFEVRFDDQVEVASQFCDPTTRVVVARVVSDGPGFITIREPGQDGPGAVLGATAVANGAQGPVTVTLERPIRQGETLLAVLHRDNGVVGTFEYTGPGTPDEPATDADGALVAPDLVVQHLEVDAHDQVVSPTDQVMVDAAVSDRDGFVVIYSDNGGAPDRALGQAAVGAGSTGPVMVTLERSVVLNERLYAVLHQDAGVLGVFEPALDLPRELDGTQVQAPLTVDFVPTVVAAPQPAGMTVTVALAVSPGEGWVVIHDGTATARGTTMLAAVHLANGGNTDVVVNLGSRGAIQGETLWAVLRLDGGQPGVPEFDGTLPPDPEIPNGVGGVVQTSFLIQ
ncbi:MAG: hypothetical protein H6730_24305 [Deltaproteobacteria bacterium]|nr:hypothetical protein [Deltaproteobacteria bacterium]